MNEVKDMLSLHSKQPFHCHLLYATGTVDSESIKADFVCFTLAIFFYPSKCKGRHVNRFKHKLTRQSLNTSMEIPEIVCGYTE